MSKSLPKLNLFFHGLGGYLQKLSQKDMHAFLSDPVHRNRKNPNKLELKMIVMSHLDRARWRRSLPVLNINGKWQLIVFRVMILMHLIMSAIVKHFLKVLLTKPDGTPGCHSTLLVKSCLRAFSKYYACLTYHWGLILIQMVSDMDAMSLGFDILCACLAMKPEKC